jgi:hypothetical protein
VNIYVELDDGGVMIWENVPEAKLDKLDDILGSPSSHKV